ncbi:MAG: Rieske 2Fe-2S domain-containing protein [Burkholderiaceae bacterium]
MANTHEKPAAKGVEPKVYTEQDFSDFAHTGPDTLAGRYMRTFWHPILRAADLPAGRAYPVTVMSEPFTVYRGHSGKAQVVAAQCAHRGTLLHTGWVEGDDLRCLYHGWKFDPHGHCVEIPGNSSSAHRNVRIRSYPTEEYMGMVFAYLGEGEAPPLPRYPEFEGDGVLDVVYKLRPCNYFQVLENNVDPAHTPFTHAVSSYAEHGLVSVPEVIGEETDWGIAQYSRRPEGVRVSHHIMPTMINIKFQPEDEDGGWKDFIGWRVPVDDFSHMNFLVSYANVSGEAAQRVRARIARRDAALKELPHFEAVARSVLRGETRLADHVDHPDLLFIQDCVAQIGQGVIADRRTEHLSRSDRLIVLLRRIWTREMRALAEGRPLKNWQRPSEAIPTIGVEAEI